MSKKLLLICDLHHFSGSAESHNTK